MHIVHIGEKKLVGEASPIQSFILLLLLFLLNSAVGGVVVRIRGGCESECRRSGRTSETKRTRCSRFRSEGGLTGGVCTKGRLPSGRSCTKDRLTSGRSCTEDRLTSGRGYTKHRLTSGRSYTEACGRSCTEGGLTSSRCSGH